MTRIVNHSDTFIQVFDNALSDVFCDDLVKYFNSKQQFLQEENDENRKDVSLLLPDFQSFNVKYKPTIEKTINTCYKQYKVDCGFPNETYGLPDSYDISTYKMQFSTYPGGGFTAWHDDYLIGRFLVWMVYLNDLQDSGKTSFFSHNTSIEPKKGTMVMFPAFFTHVHRADPDIMQDKYIITGWLRYKREYNEISE